ncbi:MAG: hypothetical protein ACC650_00290 [Gammaproteobacteria bacterium]
MAIGQELLNVPMGDMIRQMAFAIAEGQYQLDENSINVAEMMGGLTTVTDEEGKVSFDDSRVFFGYEYMTMKEANAFAVVDDALTGALDNDVIKMTEILAKIPGFDKDKDTEIRVPTRISMLELGFTPVFYNFVDTIIEVKIAIKITRTRETSRTISDRETIRNRSSSGVSGIASNFLRRRRIFGFGGSKSSNTRVTTSQVDATYASKYSYTAEGASLLRTKLSPVPPPAMLEERIRGLMDNEEARRETSLEKKRKELGLDTPATT